MQAADGIIGASLEQTTRNIGELSTEGMMETDPTILGIMLQKRFSGFSAGSKGPIARNRT